MPFSNYPNGFPGGVSILGMPILNTYTGNIKYVSSVIGSNGNQGTFLSPYATLSYALSKCKENNGDLILLMPKHAETISTAGGITIATDGVSIVGLGSGTNRPTFTFSGSTAASMVVSARSVYMQNILGVSGIDGLLNPFNIVGAPSGDANDFYFDGEWQDSSSTVEATKAFLLTSVTRIKINLKYSGEVAGDACVAAVVANDAHRVNINCDFVGKASTAWINFITTACSDVQISGYMYNSGTTDYTKDVVDTITGSTWFANFNDGTAGKIIVGGSGAALAPLT